MQPDTDTPSIDPIKPGSFLKFKLRGFLKDEVLSAAYWENHRKRRGNEGFEHIMELIQKAEKAEKKDLNAFMDLVQIATTINDHIERISRIKEFKYLRTFAGLVATWPVNQSLQPKMSQHVEEYMTSLGVGESHPLKVSESRQAAIKDVYTQAALDLIDYLLISYRVQLGTHWYARYNDPVEKSIEDPPEWFCQIGKLKRLNKDNILDWWKLAEEALLHSYPDFDKIKFLREPISDNYDEGRKKGQIKYRIRARMKSIIGENDLFTGCEFVPLFLHRF